MAYKHELTLTNSIADVDSPTIPTLGFGTFLIAPEDAAARVGEALRAGYRHIDTAQMYKNEEGVGQAIADFLAETGMDRSELFITSKLNNTFHAPDDARREFEVTLEKLQLDYIDLFLIHWPMPEHDDYVETWKTMLEFRDSGKAHAVGVSNFQIDHLERLEAETGVLPAVNQIEAHPHFGNVEVRAWCQERGIAIENWSPLGRGAVLDNPVIAEIASETGATPAQVVLSWHLSHDCIIIPKASSPARIAENFASAELRLSADQIARIDGLDQGESGRIGPNPNAVN
ncbi:aldo/keto reductase [Flaviflexus equikiangi]|uniref:aldo/keto reductase n=1 Tax=Flaviflexus equikiangi TaxID=2758573 RepID=UPI0015F522D1|nr:aldo/keto reductase [Flaviflexus equikiangi]